MLAGSPRRWFWFRVWTGPLSVATLLLAARVADGRAGRQGNQGKASEAAGREARGGIVSANAANSGSGKKGVGFQESELRAGEPEEDFPAVWSPRFVSARRAKIAPRALVFGCAVRGEAHAYAQGLLDWHEVVNDVVGGRAVVVTYCSLCNSGVVYGREAAGRTLTFGVSDRLWRNAQVMYDAETYSLWSHVTGEALAGPLKGARLTPLPVATPRIRWAAWRALHPRTQALTLDGREDAREERFWSYRHDARRVGYYPPHRVDPRASAKEMILGVARNGTARAYRYAELAHKPLVMDAAGGTPLLIYYDRANEMAAVFRRPGAGRFRLAGGVLIGPTGQSWQAATGRAIHARSQHIALPMQTLRARALSSRNDRRTRQPRFRRNEHNSVRRGRGDLEPLPCQSAYWFGWSAHYPNTSLYKAR